mmetsp:Transcript_14519/g.35159  ORF Transcript_14519/g.35159 Transcript_14519/m.35159 type:complete len:281 (-) Transcript_14519:1101-1943(-)
MASAQRALVGPGVESGRLRAAQDAQGLVHLGLQLLLALHKQQQLGVVHFQHHPCNLACELRLHLGNQREQLLAEHLLLHPGLGSSQRRGSQRCTRIEPRSWRARRPGLPRSPHPHARHSTLARGHSEHGPHARHHPWHTRSHTRHHARARRHSLSEHRHTLARHHPGHAEWHHPRPWHLHGSHSHGSRHARSHPRRDVHRWAARSHTLAQRATHTTRSAEPLLQASHSSLPALRQTNVQRLPHHLIQMHIPDSSRSILLLCKANESKSSGLPTIVAHHTH